MIPVGPYQLGVFLDYNLHLQQKQFVLCGLAHLQHQNAISFPAANDKHCADNQSCNIPNWIPCTIISALAVSCYLQSFTEEICTSQGFKSMMEE